MTHLDFLRQELGPNWVIARRTPNIVRRYGEDVICISPQCYRAIEQKYRAQYGDPHDKTRANLYCALKHAVKLLEKQAGIDAQFLDVAHAALQAEAAA